ncbi:MAG: hypothetical protein A4E33_00128 [Methanoregula sp. PtaB.Bin085]|nr:MAG: hypothetical protein A4E33_00128 [Methanoregula sp. PtaB.Bin085]
MRRSAAVFFVVLLVLASCSIAGCSSLPFSGGAAATPTPQKEAGTGAPASGLSREPVRSAVSERLDLNSTIQRMFTGDVLNDEDRIAANESPVKTMPEKKFKAIRGRDLDENGYARSWTFVIEHGDIYSVVMFSGNKVQVSDSPGMLSQSVIDTSKIMLPRELFDKNRAVISNTTRTGIPVTRDLSISDGRATLTIRGSSGVTRILVFDATTGVLNSSND